MIRPTTFLFLLISFTLALTTGGKIEAKDNPSPRDFLLTPRAVETKTYFKDELESTRSVLPFDTDFIDDKEMEYGLEKELEEGIPGELVRTYKVTYWQGQEIYRVLDSEKIVKAVNQKVLRGTKIIWQDLPTTDQGPLKYWRKMRVWATSYDPNCYGCTGRTFSGTEVVVGTCAVDPRVIVMGSHFYVPGYGICSAFTDIYLLDGQPKD